MWDHSFKNFHLPRKAAEITSGSIQILHLMKMSFKVSHNAVMSHHPTVSKVPLGNDTENISNKTAIIMWIRKPVKWAVANNESIVRLRQAMKL